MKKYITKLFLGTLLLAGASSAASIDVGYVTFSNFNPGFDKLNLYVRTDGQYNSFPVASDVKITSASALLSVANWMELGLDNQIVQIFWDASPLNPFDTTGNARSSELFPSAYNIIAAQINFTLDHSGPWDLTNGQTFIPDAVTNLTALLLPANGGPLQDGQSPNPNDPAQNFSQDLVSLQVNGAVAVPEPSTIGLSGVGLGFFLYAARRRKTV